MSVFATVSPRLAQPMGVPALRTLAAAALVFTASLAQAAPFTNGSFSSTAGWVLQGGASYGNTTNFPTSNLPAGQAVAVLQASPGGPAASFTQTFDHVASAYNISFDLAAPSMDAAMGLGVTFNTFNQIPVGQSLATAIYPVAPGATNYTFLPSGWIRVAFQNVSPVQPFTGSPLGVTQDQISLFTLSPALVNSQLLVRNLVVDAITAPIPEPQTYALMLLGLGGVLAVARRRSAKA